MNVPIKAADGTVSYPTFRASTDYVLSAGKLKCFPDFMCLYNDNCN